MRAGAMDAVTAILLERAQGPPGLLPRMLTLSLAAHAALASALLLAPDAWMARRDEPRTVMTITLGGGAPGPQNGGMTLLGGRPVQVITTLPNPKRPEPIRPPAAKTPDMTLPVPQARPSEANAAEPVHDAPADARGQTPTAGPDTAAGSAVAETGARGQGFGLSTGGGAGSGGYIDVANFCCPEYLTTTLEFIRRNWAGKQEVRGESLVRFTIQRDGRLTFIEVERSSGYTTLDITAERALRVTRQVQPLPSGFPNDSLTVHLNFQYQ